MPLTRPCRASRGRGGLYWARMPLHDRTGGDGRGEGQGNIEGKREGKSEGQEQQH